MPERDSPGYERRDVSGRWLLITLGCFLACFALALLGSYWALRSDLVEQPPPPPVAAEVPPVPQPHLLIDPRGELERFRQEKHAQLNGAGWVNRAAGIAHIPIEQAMAHVAANGLPRWPQPAEPGPGERAREAYREALQAQAAERDAGPVPPSKATRASKEGAPPASAGRAP